MRKKIVSDALLLNLDSWAGVHKVIGWHPNGGWRKIDLSKKSFVTGLLRDGLSAEGIGGIEDQTEQNHFPKIAY